MLLEEQTIVDFDQAIEDCTRVEHQTAAVMPSKLSSQAVPLVVEAEDPEAAAAADASDRRAAGQRDFCASYQSMSAACVQKTGVGDS